MKILWTPRAEATFDKVIDYLMERWTAKEALTFVEETEKVILQIQQMPYMFKQSGKHTEIRKGYITPQNALYYRIKPRKKEIHLLTFWDTRQDPAKMKG